MTQFPRTLHNPDEVNSTPTVSQFDEYRMYVEHAGDIIARLSPSGCFQYLSPACRVQLGFAPEELSGQSLQELLHPEDAPLLRTVLAPCDDAQASDASLTVRFRAKNENYCWFLLDCRRLPATGDAADSDVLMIAHNITARKEAEEELRQQASECQAILSRLPEGLWVADAGGAIVHWNQSVLKLFNLAPDENLMSLLADLPAHFELSTMDGGVLSTVDWPIARLLRGDAVSQLVLSIQHRDSEWRRVFNFNGEVVPDENGATLLAVLTMQDITAGKLTEQRLYYQATHDQLTGLPNRALFTEHLDNALLTAKRKKGRLAVLFLDLDRFKPINDEYGHAIGDRVLQVIAQRLRTALRASDISARMGGDEFTVLLTDYQELDGVRVTARRLHTAISNPISLNEQTFSLTASIGISCYPDDADSATELISMADNAMYHAKQQHSPYIFSQHERARRSASR